ncbi:hypothetical protein RR42_s1941 [Cupriavidus basilensis]|uniref:Uncharacterized protein n=1 Tax=Cupriavidus basilensis TaxID=68895 RepID=A0A0C4YN92_9BURK|nr:hypothetical protein RR42_s1941 [Cupriavidus basilensis]
MSSKIARKRRLGLGRNYSEWGKWRQRTVRGGFDLVGANQQNNTGCLPLRDTLIP